MTDSWKPRNLFLTNTASKILVRQQTSTKTCIKASINGLAEYNTNQKIIPEELWQLHADDIIIQREEGEGPLIPGDI